MRVTIRRVGVIPPYNGLFTPLGKSLKLVQLKNNLWPNKRLRRRAFPLLKDIVDPGVCAERQPLHF